LELLPYLCVPLQPWVTNTASKQMWSLAAGLMLPKAVLTSRKGFGGGHLVPCSPPAGSRADGAGTVYLPKL